MKKEIEVKVKVSDIDSVIKSLSNLGCILSEPVTQNDVVYINYNRPFIDFREGDIFLRIRKTQGKVIFTLKKGEEMNSIEKEFSVDDAQQLHDTLTLLGFRPEVEVTKIRRKTSYNNYEICIDDVPGLGFFIELEEITENDAIVTQNAMINFLNSIGIDTKDRVMNGYDTLTWLKNNPGHPVN